ncbi:MAG TPA: tetratricopeptide repeat protein, partial [Candidatus Saccharimonadales bacterium]|nr:tetratricopeptide repeat protein [Candidatus Saccharimonadales bacterium]
VSLGRSLREEEGALPESLALLERAVKSHPEDARARLELARSLRTAGRPREAIETLKGVADPPPSQAPFIEMEWGRACYATGDLDCAVRRIGRYFKEWRGIPKPAQTSVDAALDLGRAWLEKGDRAKALEQFKVAADLGDSLATWYRSQADEALKAGKPEAAENDWKQALEWSPLDPRAYYALGDHLAVSGRWEEALGIWRSLIDGHPDDVHGLSGAVTALDSLGRSGETAPLIEHLINVEMNADAIAALRARLASLKAGESSGSD